MYHSLSSRAWVALAALAVSLPVGFAGVGQLLPPTSPVVIDDGASSPAFQTTGTWVTLALPGNAERDSLRYATKGTATWTASVRPGTYAVEVSVPPMLRIVQQTYSVTDGSSVIGTFVVSRYTKGDKKPLSNWIPGATVSTANGTIAVTLSVPAGIGVADAVRITPVPESSSSSSTPLPPPPLCGNGSVEGSEQCDSGSANGQPCMAPAGTSCTYCSASCTRVTVDGIRPSSSSSSAPAPVCGNGSVEGSEQCDDGSANGRICETVIGGSCAYCSASCVRVVVDGPRPSSSSSSASSAPAPQCGNGVKENGELCDDGSANGRICETVIGGSCTYCSASCTPVIVDGPRPSSSSSSSTATVGTCSDGIDGDADGGADVASLTDPVALGTKNRLSVISYDVAKNVTYFMQQGESNSEQTIEARDARNVLIATKKFDTAAIRRDVFGSPAIDSWTKMFTKPYFSDFTTANGNSVFGLVSDSTVADVIIGTTGKPAPRTLKETKIVRFSSDLSTIEAVLPTGSDRFQHGYLYPTPDGKSLVLFAVGLVKRVETGSANEYAAPFILVIDAETFTVKSRYSVATNDMALPYPLFVGNDKIVFALNSMKLSGVGIFTSVERFPVQVIEYVPSTGVARVVAQPFNGMLDLPGDPRALSDGSSAYMVALRESKTPAGVRTQTMLLTRIDLSTLATVATLEMPTDFGSSTKILRLLSNGYLATLRTRFVRDGVYDEEVLLFDMSRVTGTVPEQAATVREGAMLRTQDGRMVRTNRSVPRSVFMSYEQVSGRFFDYDATAQSMVVRGLKHDAQCTSVSTPE